VYQHDKQPSTYLYCLEVDTNAPAGHPKYKNAQDAQVNSVPKFWKYNAANPEFWFVGIYDHPEKIDGNSDTVPALTAAHALARVECAIEDLERNDEHAQYSCSDKFLHTTQGLRSAGVSKDRWDQPKTFGCWQSRPSTAAMWDQATEEDQMQASYIYMQAVALEPLRDVSGVNDTASPIQCNMRAAIAHHTRGVTRMDEDGRLVEPVDEEGHLLHDEANGAKPWLMVAWSASAAAWAAAATAATAVGDRAAASAMYAGQKVSADAVLFSLPTQPAVRKSPTQPAARKLPQRLQLTSMAVCAALRGVNTSADCEPAPPGNLAPGTKCVEIKFSPNGVLLLKSCPKLKIIDLTECRLVTKQAVEQLRTHVSHHYAKDGKVLCQQAQRTLNLARFKQFMQGGRVSETHDPAGRWAELRRRLNSRFHNFKELEAEADADGDIEINTLKRCLDLSNTEVNKLSDQLKFLAHDLVVDLRAWPHWRHLVDDDLVCRACALNAEMTQLRLDLIEVTASCNNLSIKFTAVKFNSKNEHEAFFVKFPTGAPVLTYRYTTFCLHLMLPVQTGSYTLEGFLAQLQRTVEVKIPKAANKPTATLSITHGLKYDRLLRSVRACCSFQLITDSATDSAQLVLEASSASQSKSVLHLLGWRENLEINSSKSVVLETSPTSSVSQALVSEENALERLATPVLDGQMKQLPFIQRAVPTRHAVWESYAWYYGRLSPYIAKMNDRVRYSDPEQDGRLKITPLKIEPREATQKALAEAKKTTNRTKQHVQKIKNTQIKNKQNKEELTSEQKQMNTWIKDFRKRCEHAVQQMPAHFEHSGMVGIRVLQESEGGASNEDDRHKMTIAAESIKVKSNLGFALLHESTTHCASDLLLFLVNGNTKSVLSQFASEIKRHSASYGTTLPAIIVSVDNEETDQKVIAAQIEQLEKMKVEVTEGEKGGVTEGEKEQSIAHFDCGIDSLRNIISIKKESLLLPFKPSGKGGFLV
jgi:hypothetical protein